MAKSCADTKWKSQKGSCWEQGELPSLISTIKSNRYLDQLVRTK
jgi:hypothetical protein